MIKYIFLLLILTGCYESRIRDVNPSALKFKAGQKVKTTINFYSNCEGIIINYHPYTYEDKTPTYMVSMKCPEVVIDKTIGISETSLIAIENNN